MYGDVPDWFLKLYFKKKDKNVQPNSKHKIILSLDLRITSIEKSYGYFRKGVGSTSP